MVSIWPVWMPESQSKEDFEFCPKAYWKLRSYTALLNEMMLSILTAAQWDLSKCLKHVESKLENGDLEKSLCWGVAVIFWSVWIVKLQGRCVWQMGKESDVVIWKMHVLGKASVKPALLESQNHRILLCLQHDGKWGYVALAKTQLNLVSCSETLAEPPSAWWWTSNAHSCVFVWPDHGLPTLACFLQYK